MSQIHHPDLQLESYSIADVSQRMNPIPCFADASDNPCTQRMHNLREYKILVAFPSLQSNSKRAACEEFKEDKLGRETIQQTNPSTRPLLVTQRESTPQYGFPLVL
jgi:hypothetical protein